MLIIMVLLCLTRMSSIIQKLTKYEANTTLFGLTVFQLHALFGFSRTTHTNTINSYGFKYILPEALGTQLSVHANVL